MNIGIFTDSYHPEISGLVTSIDILQSQLKERGHNVYVFTTSNPGIRSKRRGVFRLPSMPFIFLKSRRVGLFYTPRAVKCVKRLNLDIIHTQTEFSLGIFGKIMAKKLGIPVVHTYHTLYKDYVHYISKDKFKRFSDDLVKILSRNFCNGCDAVIAPTQKVYDLLRDYGVKKSISIVPTGIRLCKFNSGCDSEVNLEELKQSLSIGSNDPVILFVGRLAKEKRVDIIIGQMPYILRCLPDAKLLIVGDGTSRRTLESLAAQLHLNKSVIFAGEQAWDKIHMYYKLGGVFVSSSVTETQGLTIIEAMASGVPVAAIRDRNIEDLIKDRWNGRIFDSESELCEAVVDILSDKRTSQMYVKNASQTLYEYSSLKFSMKVEEIYTKLLKEKILT